MALTVEGISRARAKPPGDRWLSDKTAERNAGRLLLRVSASGVKRFYYRYSVPGRDRIVMPLEVFAEKPRPGAMTLDQARGRARELSAIHKQDDSRDVRAYLEAQALAKASADAADREAVARREAEVAAARKYNVKALAAEYVKHLERASKTRSAQDARNIFKNHLDSSTLGALPAKDVQARDATALLRGLVEAGKGRTAAKLRSYLRAAYAVAMRSEADANAPAAFIPFQVGSNPLAGTAALSEFSKTRDRYLTEDELSSYWKRLQALTPEPVRDALKLAILLGGQRVAQLLRLRRVDVDLTGGFLTLRDPKGKRKQPRVHELPISPQAMAVIKPLMERAAAWESDWVFTSDGKVATYPDTLTAAVRGVSAAMKKGKETPEPFKLSDLRRTAETLMAGMGISRDIRAQIQSHGLSGVQTRHYDRHDYRAEKRRALNAWARRLTEGTGRKVIPGNFDKRRKKA